MLINEAQIQSSAVPVSACTASPPDRFSPPTNRLIRLDRDRYPEAPFVAPDIKAAIDLKISFLARPPIHSIKMSRSNFSSTLSVGKSDVRLTPAVWKSLRHSSSNSAWNIKNYTAIG